MCHLLLLCRLPAATPQHLGGTMWSKCTIALSWSAPMAHVSFVPVKESIMSYPHVLGLPPTFPLHQMPLPPSLPPNTSLCSEGTASAYETLIKKGAFISVRSVYLDCWLLKTCAWSLRCWDTIYSNQLSRLITGGSPFLL